MSEAVGAGPAAAADDGTRPDTAMHDAVAAVDAPLGRQRGSADGAPRALPPAGADEPAAASPAGARRAEPDGGRGLDAHPMEVSAGPRPRRCLQGLHATGISV
jgi:hypothetical protein